MPITELLYNSAVLVGPDGVVGTYRKLHLAAEDRAWATPGNLGLPTFDIPPGRVGMLIGYDALFPEAARSLALDGADIIACPSLLSWPPVLPYGETAVPMPPFVEAGPTDAHFHLWRERERENNAHVLFANGAAPWQGWSGCFAAVLGERAASGIAGARRPGRDGDARDRDARHVARQGSGPDAHPDLV